MKNKKIIIFVVMFILVFTYFYSSMNTEIIKGLDAMIISKDSEIEEQTKVYINGRLDKRVFESNVILGTIRVGDDIFYQFMMKKENGYYQGYVYLADVEVGKVAASSGFDLFWTDLKELDEEYNADTFVAAPAKNKEEAINVEREIFGN